MVTTAADLTVVPRENGITILYRTDSEAQRPTVDWLADKHRKMQFTNVPMELAVEDLQICYDRGRNLDHLNKVLPMVVRDTAAAYLYLHYEDDAYRVYTQPVGQLDSLLV